MTLHSWSLERPGSEAGRQELLGRPEFAVLVPHDARMSGAQAWVILAGDGRGNRMAETRTKVYQGLQEQQRDEADAVAHGWRVVARESEREGYRVTYELGSGWSDTSTPRHRRGLRKATWLVIIWNVAFAAALAGARPRRPWLHQRHLRGDRHEVRSVRPDGRLRLHLVHRLPGDEPHLVHEPPACLTVPGTGFSVRTRMAASGRRRPA